MPFLVINGITMRVADSSVTQGLRRKGRRDRAFRGQLRDNRRGIRRTWSVETRVADYAEAMALEHMIGGAGHFADLRDGLQCSSGLVAEAGRVAGRVLVPAGAAAYGLGHLFVPGGTTGTVLAYDAQLVGDWTVLLRRKVAGVWVGHAVRSDGSAFVGGSSSFTFGLPLVSGGSGLLVRVHDGVAEIVKDGDDDEAIDDVVVLPYRMSDSLLVVLTGAGAPQFGPCPLLRVSGDMFGAGVTAFALGTVLDTEVVQGPSQVPGLGWANNARVARFALDLVDEAYVRAVSV